MLRKKKQSEVGNNNNIHKVVEARQHVTLQNSPDHTFV